MYVHFKAVRLRPEKAVWSADCNVFVLLLAWFPDPHTQTQSSTQGNGQLLSIGDQPLASRVNTPIGQNTSTTGGGHLGESSSSTAVGGRPTSSQLVDSPRRSNNNNVNGGQFHHQHSYGSSSFQNHPIELAERVQNSNDDTRLA